MHILARSIILFILLLILGACTAGYNEEKTLRVGITDWLGYQPFMWAEENYLDKGAFSFAELPSNSEAVRLFNNGMIDIACVTLDDALRLYQYNDDLVVIAVLDISNGGDMMITAPDITDLASLKGRRIGYEHEGAGSYMLFRILEKGGIDTNEVKLVPIPFYHHKERFLNKEVDAVITFEPTASALIEAGGHKLFDSSMIPNEVVDILITRRSVVKQYPNRLQHLLDGWYRASADIDSRLPASIGYMGNYLGMDADQLDSGLSTIAFPQSKASKSLLLSPDFSATLQRMKSILYKMEQIESADHKNLIIDKEILEKLY